MYLFRYERPGCIVAMSGELSSATSYELSAVSYYTGEVSLGRPEPWSCMGRREVRFRWFGKIVKNKDLSPYFFDPKLKVVLIRPSRSEAQPDNVYKHENRRNRSWQCCLLAKKSQCYASRKAIILNGTK